MRRHIIAAAAVMALLSGCGSNLPQAGAAAATPSATPDPAADRARAVKALDDAIWAMRDATTARYRTSLTAVRPPNKGWQQAPATKVGSFDLSSGTWSVKSFWTGAFEHRGEELRAVGDSLYSLPVDGKWTRFVGAARGIDAPLTTGLGTNVLPLPLFLITQTTATSIRTDAGQTVITGTVPAKWALEGSNEDWVLDDAGYKYGTVDGTVPVELTLDGAGRIATARVLFARGSYTSKKKALTTPWKSAIGKAEMLTVFLGWAEPVTVRAPSTFTTFQDKDAFSQKGTSTSIVT